MSATPDADDTPDRLSADSRGRGAIAIAQVVGNIIVSIFADGAKKWSLPPFYVVIALVAVALLRNPGGPQDQFSWTYALMGAAVLATGLRALAIVGSERGRVLITVVSFTCVVAALVWTEYLRSHGEVDVTGRVAISPSGPVSDGGRIDVVIDGAPRRSHLRLTLAVEDADPRTQSCVPETTLGLILTGRGRPVVVEQVTGGSAVDLPLGGFRSVVSATVTVHADKGCVMNVSVATAVLHD
ncbi:hypothetical protein [Embleya sp. NPDC005575]|uniref:hypothetical protein n=1 Tax=Embleya sp. NPDC005575 TaxID=3156892 RepID=UPI0033B06E52